jgi:hypothetical protein
MSVVVVADSASDLGPWESHTCEMPILILVDINFTAVSLALLHHCNQLI